MKRFVLAVLLTLWGACALAADFCALPQYDKSSVVVNISTAATTQLVALSTGKAVYVCSVALSISQVVTTANTIKFVGGTGASCGTGTTDLTGAFGAGGVTAGTPIVVNVGAGHTMFTAPMSNALCATTTIGGSASFVGVVTYVQR